MTMDFKLNTNVPQPCLTGYLPPQQKRTPNFEDTPPRPPGYLYCRIPQDSWNAVRGARNYPCLTHPGKRAPTAEMLAVLQDDLRTSRKNLVEADLTKSLQSEKWKEAEQLAERLLTLEALADGGKNRHLPIGPLDPANALGSKEEVFYIVSLCRSHAQVSLSVW